MKTRNSLRNLAEIYVQIAEFCRDFLGILVEFPGKTGVNRGICWEKQEIIQQFLKN